MTRSYVSNTPWVTIYNSALRMEKNLLIFGKSFFVYQNVRRNDRYMYVYGLVIFEFFCLHRMGQLRNMRLESVYHFSGFRNR